MFDVNRDDITGGSLARALVVLAVPLVAQNLALVAQQVVDLFWVGRLGSDAVAGVGLATVVIALVSVPLLALFTGSQVLTSQRVGADRILAARRVPFTAAAMAVAVAVVLGAGLFAFAEPVVALFDAGPAASVAAATYLAAFAFALVTQAASDTLESGFTGWGDTKAAFAVNVVAIVVNLTLDPLLILGVWVFPRWEVFGAAVATAIGYGVGALFALALAYRGREEFRLTRRAVVPELATAREVVEVGGPIAVKNSGQQVARLVVVGIVATVGGAPGLAAYYLGWQVATLAFVPPNGLGQAATSIIGQNLGADRPDRASRTTWLAVAIAVVGLALLGAVQWLFPRTLALLFVPEMSGQALEYSMLYLEILAYGYWALGAIYTLEAGFNGAGRTKVSMYATLLQYWGVRLPIAAVGAFVLLLDMSAVFWAVTISNVAAAVGLMAYYYHSASNGMLREAAEEAGTTAAD
jgi:putative MATE family efflux protein